MKREIVVTRTVYDCDGPDCTEQIDARPLATDEECFPVDWKIMCVYGLGSISYYLHFCSPACDANWKQEHA